MAGSRPAGTLWAGAYEAKISPSRWIEPSTGACGSPGHWQRMIK
jgi:hypothetical protein